MKYTPPTPADGIVLNTMWLKLPTGVAISHEGALPLAMFSLLMRITDDQDLARDMPIFNLINL